MVSAMEGTKHQKQEWKWAGVHTVATAGVWWKQEGQPKRRTATEKKVIKEHERHNHQSRKMAAMDIQCQT